MSATPRIPLTFDRLLTEAEVAELLGIPGASLKRARLTGRPHPPYIRLGERSIRYRESAVELYLAGRTVESPALTQAGDAAC